MLICKVVGHVWATKKEEGLEGLKLMVVQEIDGTGRKKGNTFVAADVVGTARKAVGRDTVPVDAAIVAIIDTVEVNREAARGSE